MQSRRKITRFLSCVMYRKLYTTMSTKHAVVKERNIGRLIVNNSTMHNKPYVGDKCQFVKHLFPL